MAHRIAAAPEPRELDMLLTAGERIAMSLLAIAVCARGCHAASYTGSQAGIITDSQHGAARIVEIRPKRIAESLDKGDVVIVAGFQGLSVNYDITTLGRGGSDTTAVALAAALGAEVCEIYTDVDGVFTADPRVVPDAAKIDRISYEEMLELAAAGAKVLQSRSVEYARRFDLPIHVRSSFSKREGTWVVAEASQAATPDIEGEPVEQPIIPNILPDLRRFGCRFPHIYTDLLVAPSLFNWERERHHQQRLFSQWRARIPASRQVLAGVPWLLRAECAPVPFSRLTLTAQLEVLARPIEESWQACAQLNPFLVHWKELAGGGKLAPADWPEQAAQFLSGEAYDRKWHGLLAAQNARPATAAAVKAQDQFIRERLATENLYPLTWSTKT